MALAQYLANRDVVLGVELVAASLLRFAMLGGRAPRFQRFFRVALDDGDAFAIVGPKAVVRDVAGHGDGELAHLFDQRDVFVLQAGPQAGAEYDDDHRMILPVFYCFSKERSAATSS